LMAMGDGGGVEQTKQNTKQFNLQRTKRTVQKSVSIDLRLFL